MAAGIYSHDAVFIHYHSRTGIIRLIGTIPLKGNELGIGFTVNKNTTYTSAHISPATNYGKTNVTWIVCVDIHIHTYIGKNIIL